MACKLGGNAALTFCGVSLTTMLKTPNRTAKTTLSLDEARARLAAPARRERIMPLLAAAGLAAVSALALAASVILGPPGLEHAQAAPAPIHGQG
jgi:hypothetical protein